MRSCPRRPRVDAGVIPAALLALAALFAVMSSSLRARAQTLADTGKWSPAANWSEGNGGLYAVHMMLLPGDATFHSRLLWWRGAGAIFNGREMGWRPGTAGCDLFPSSFTNLGAPAAPGMDVFCSGHAALADGRMLVAGGTHPVNGDYGENRTRIFTAGSGTATGAWSDPGKMKDFRWYPSATTLRDGRVLVTSGLKHVNVWTFGGRRGGNPPSQPTGDSLHRFAPVIDVGASNGLWESSVIPDPHQGIGLPPVREGHTMIDLPDEFAVGGGRPRWSTAARMAAARPR